MVMVKKKAVKVDGEELVAVIAKVPFSCQDGDFAQGAKYKVTKEVAERWIKVHYFVAGVK